MANLKAKLSYYQARWLGAHNRFNAIYRANIWDDNESVSGKGSRKDSQPVREALEALKFIKDQYQLNSIADIPCGDVNWIRIFLDENPNITYHGYDIVSDLISRNNQVYPHLSFSEINIIEDRPNSFDLIFCKDLLNHLTNREIISSLRNIVMSKSSWLLVTNNFGALNTELPIIRMSTSRPVDLTLPPFNLPAPEWQTSYFAFWRLDMLQSALGCKVMDE